MTAIKNGDTYLDAVTLVDSTGSPVSFGGGGASVPMQPSAFDQIGYTYTSGKLATKTFRLSGVIVGTVAYTWVGEDLTNMLYTGV